MVRMFRNKMIQAARMGKMSILVMKTPVTSKCPFGWKESPAFRENTSIPSCLLSCCKNRWKAGSCLWDSLEELVGVVGSLWKKGWKSCKGCGAGPGCWGLLLAAPSQSIWKQREVGIGGKVADSKAGAPWRGGKVERRASTAFLSFSCFLLGLDPSEI